MKLGTRSCTFASILAVLSPCVNGAPYSETLKPVALRRNVLVSATIISMVELYRMRLGRILAAPIIAAMQLATVPLLWCTVPMGVAQSPTNSSPAQARPTRPRDLPDRLPDRPSIPPAFSIPIEPLGFSAPGPIYLGQRNSLASLDFLDENRLLFSFRVPGLMHREAGENAGSDERQIRAVVLGLPEGTVTAE